MLEAIQLATKAFQQDEIPVGCVVVKDGQIIGRGHNTRQKDHHISHHAEINALEEAGNYLKDWHLDGCDLYVTLEPCFMCAAAIMQARIANVYYGAFDTQAGAFGSLYDLSKVTPLNHKPKVYGGIMQSQCERLITTYFKNKRKDK